MNGDAIVKVDRLIEIKQEMERLKQEAAQIEGFFLKAAETDLANTKLKTVEYAGHGGKVVATMAQSLKTVYPTFLKQVFGAAYSDVVTEETKYKINAAATRMLSGLWLKNYSEMRVQDVVNQIETDEKTKAALLKKAEGNKLQNGQEKFNGNCGFG